jgi:hypothetical protein
LRPALYAILSPLEANLIKMITSITVNNDDGTNVVFVPQGTVPEPRKITVPLNTPIILVAE